MRPKQFLGVTEDASLFQLTLQRLQGITADVMRPIGVANNDHRFLVGEQCREAGVEPHSIVLEPVARNTAPAIAAAALAGFVDAAGFLSAQGYFVSFMSGNTTRLGVDLALRPMMAIIPAMLIAGFLLGVFVGALLAARAGAQVTLYTPRPNNKPIIRDYLLGVAEVAQVQQVPEGTVKTRLFHARRQMRDCVPAGACCWRRSCCSCRLRCCWGWCRRSWSSSPSPAPSGSVAPPEPCMRSDRWGISSAFWWLITSCCTTPR
jgi:hypothetical protein